METELCNMCMVTDSKGRVLVQERLPKPSNSWSGLTFPGGHVEPGETVVASVIREVQEETGLTVSPFHDHNADKAEFLLIFARTPYLWHIEHVYESFLWNFPSVETQSYREQAKGGGD